MVLAGLVVTAVGCQTVIEEPHGAGSLTVGLLVGGGPLLYVATRGWYLHVTTHQKLTRRWIGCTTLAVAIPIAIVVPPLVALGLVAVTLALSSPSPHGTDTRTARDRRGLSQGGGWLMA